MILGLLADGLEGGDDWVDIDDDDDDDAVNVYANGDFDDNVTMLMLTFMMLMMPVTKMMIMFTMRMTIISWKMTISFPAHPREEEVGK